MKSSFYPKLFAAFLLLTTIWQCQYDEVEPLYADFSAQGGGVQALAPVKFTNSSVGAKTWAWDFGNGQTSNLQTPSAQTYSSEGSYTVSLTVTNGAGASDTKTISLAVGPPPDVLAQFSAPGFARKNELVSFVNSSLFASSYYWDFGNGVTSTEKDPVRSFSTTGTQNVTLTASNAKGSDTESAPIEICDTPVAAFTTTSNSYNQGVNITFTNTSISNASDGYTNYFWDFGNGQTYYGKDAIYAYPQTGTYTVRLKASNPCGEDWSDTKVLQINQVAGAISSLDCSSAILNGNLIIGQSSSGLSISVPYFGGNGGPHNGQTVNSTDITGLVATLSPGNFTNGSGVLTYNLSGIPSNFGTAKFSLNIGDKTCSLSVPVLFTCNAKISATESKSFLCYNLGTANQAADPFSPSWQINGGYYQWGRVTQAAAGPTGPAAGQANYGAITGWPTSSAPNNAWIDNSKTSNDPCPNGFRVPTLTEWYGVVNNNSITYNGTWNDDATNYGSGVKLGNYLFLPSAGSRLNTNGAGGGRGSFGGYWSSTQIISNNSANWLFFNSNYINVGYYDNDRAAGRSVRCIAE